MESSSDPRVSSPLSKHLPDPHLYSWTQFEGPGEWPRLAVQVCSVFLNVSCKSTPACPFLLVLQSLNSVEHNFNHCFTRRATSLDLLAFVCMGLCCCLSPGLCPPHTGWSSLSGRNQKVTQTGTPINLCSHTLLLQLESPSNTRTHHFLFCGYKEKQAITLPGHLFLVHLPSLGHCSGSSCFIPDFPLSIRAFLSAFTPATVSSNF